MSENIFKLSLYQPATYQIKVPGPLHELWTDNIDAVSIKTQELSDGQLISIVTGQMDQAQLQGLLRQFYGLGLPLISAICLNFMEDPAAEDL